MTITIERPADIDEDLEETAVVEPETPTIPTLTVAFGQPVVLGEPAPPRGICQGCGFAIILTGKGYVSNHNPRVLVDYRLTSAGWEPVYSLRLGQCAGSGERPVKLEAATEPLLSMPSRRKPRGACRTCRHRAVLDDGQIAPHSQRVQRGWLPDGSPRIWVTSRACGGAGMAPGPESTRPCPICRKNTATHGGECAGCCSQSIDLEVARKRGEDR